MTMLRGKTLFITGASRGIGLAIALKAARDGANIAIAAKTAEPNPKLEGTIHSAAAEIEKAGILMLSPPLDMKAKWFAPHVAYTMAKYTMSLCVLGMAEELATDRISVNALWPRTAIATAAVKNLLGGDRLMAMSRKPDILADAAYLLFTQPRHSLSGQFLIDDTFLHTVGGVTDFEPYRVDARLPLAADFFVPEDSVPPPGVHVSQLLAG